MESAHAKQVFSMFVVFCRVSRCKQSVKELKSDKLPGSQTGSEILNPASKDRFFPLTNTMG